MKKTKLGKRPIKVKTSKKNMKRDMKLAEKWVKKLARVDKTKEEGIFTDVFDILREHLGKNKVSKEEQITNLDYTDLMVLLKNSREHFIFKNNIPKKHLKGIKGVLVNLICKKGTSLDQVSNYADKILKDLDPGVDVIWSVMLKERIRKNNVEIIVVK